MAEPASLEYEVKPFGYTQRSGIAELVIWGICPQLFEDSPHWFQEHLHPLGIPPRMKKRSPLLMVSAAFVVSCILNLIRSKYNQILDF